jgi:hypothetical protein
VNHAPDSTFLARTFEDDTYAWARARPVRRRLVIVEASLLGALAAATLVASAGGDGWTTAYFVVWTIGLIGFIPIHSLLNLGIRGLFDRRGSSLDEHQRALRERSFIAMAWGTSALTLAAWAGGVSVQATTGHTALALCLGFILWFAAGLLAYWHLAWTLPDEQGPGRSHEGDAPATDPV